MITFCLEGPPIPWKRPGKAADGHSYDAQKKEKETLRWRIKGQYLDPPIKGPLKFGADFFFKIPPYVSQIKKVEMSAGFFKHIQKPDIDNLLKFYMDVLTGVVWEDDCQIFSFMESNKRYAENPKVVLKVLDLSHNKVALHATP